MQEEKILENSIDILLFKKKTKLSLDEGWLYSKTTGIKSKLLIFLWDDFLVEMT